MTWFEYAISCLIVAVLFGISIGAEYLINFILPIIERTIGWDEVGLIFTFFILSFLIFGILFGKKE